MNVNALILSSNPFIDAYFLSDMMGKLIFVGLISLSICSWMILIYKSWMTFQARRNSALFQKIFDSQQASPLSIENALPLSRKENNSFLDIYDVLCEQTKEMLNKNRHFAAAVEQRTLAVPYLSPTDIETVESHLFATIAFETRRLENHLYILSTIVSLAPFLGLLGTVWGILTTFAELQAHTGGGSHQMVLGGLSLALATTVLGLLDAIPALIGYNYLKNAIGQFETEMECFALKILTVIEMQYRKPDFAPCLVNEE